MNAVVQRVLIALQTGSHAPTLLQFLREIAGLGPLELQGLRMEESELSRSLRLPCVREMGIHLPAPRPLAVQDVARSLQLLEREMARFAVAMQASWRWQEAGDAAGAAERLADLLIMDVAEFFGVQQQQLQRNILQLLERQASPMLLIPRERYVGHWLVMPWHGTAEDTALLQQARAFARRYHRQVLLLVDTPHATSAPEPDALTEVRHLAPRTTVQRVMYELPGATLLRGVADLESLMHELQAFLQRPRYPLLLLPSKPAP